MPHDASDCGTWTPSARNETDLESRSDFQIDAGGLVIGGAIEIIGPQSRVAGLLVARRIFAAIVSGDGADLVGLFLDVASVNLRNSPFRPGRSLPSKRGHSALNPSPPASRVSPFPGRAGALLWTRTESVKDVTFIGTTPARAGSQSEMAGATTSGSATSPKPTSRWDVCATWPISHGHAVIFKFHPARNWIRFERQVEIFWIVDRVNVLLEVFAREIGIGGLGICRRPGPGTARIAPDWR